MIVVTNRMSVAAGFEKDFEERFQRRAGLVDGSAGFVRNEVHRPRPVRFDRETGWRDDPTTRGCYEVQTWWRSFDDFVAWTQSPSFREAHAERPPQGMFSAPNQLEVHEVISSSEG